MSIAGNAKVKGSLQRHGSAPPIGYIPRTHGSLLLLIPVASLLQWCRSCAANGFCGRPGPGPGSPTLVPAPEAMVPSRFIMTHSPQTSHFALFLAASASLLVASSSNAVSTAPEGRCTYRTTDPRINMSFVEHCHGISLDIGSSTFSLDDIPAAFCRIVGERSNWVRLARCGHLSSSTASALSSLIFRY